MTLKFHTTTLIWPSNQTGDCLTTFCLFILSAEAGLGRGADAAAEQSHQPPRRDDGHSGDWSVSVQRQADGREGPPEAPRRLRSVGAALWAVYQTDCLCTSEKVCDGGG